MITIWKYPIEMGSEFTVEMPKKARILCVQMQRGRPQMWALVDTDAPLKKARFHLAMTGERLANAFEEMGTSGEWKYRGTFQAGVLVCHLFENYSPYEHVEVT